MSSLIRWLAAKRRDRPLPRFHREWPEWMLGYKTAIDQLVGPYVENVRIEGLDIQVDTADVTDLGDTFRSVIAVGPETFRSHGVGTPPQRPRGFCRWTLTGGLHDDYLYGGDLEVVEHDDHGFPSWTTHHQLAFQARYLWLSWIQIWGKMAAHWHKETRRREAEERAQIFLFSLIDIEQRDNWINHQYIIEGEYRLDGSHNVQNVVTGGPTYCIVGKSSTPKADQVATKLLSLRADKRKFLNIGGRYAPDPDPDGDIYY